LWGETPRSRPGGGVAPKRVRRTGVLGLRRQPAGDGKHSTWRPDRHPHTAGLTFSNQVRAQGWLANELGLIERGEWTPPPVLPARPTRPGVPGTPNAPRH